MKRKNKILNNLSRIFIVISIPISLFSLPKGENKDNKIWLVKQRWHTGLVLQRNQVDTTTWPEITQFKNYNYVDVGWGDEKFYQHSGFNILLAARALFIPTSSTIRVFAFNLSIDQYIGLSDRAIEIRIDKEQLDSLCSYIHETYLLDKTNKPILLSEQFNGTVKFYKAKGEYHLLNTCNTWAADGLKRAGFKNFSSSIILVNELFNQAKRIGEEIK